MYQSPFFTAFKTERNCLINDGIFNLPNQNVFWSKTLMSKSHISTRCFDKENQMFCRICFPKMRFVEVSRMQTPESRLAQESGWPGSRSAP